MHRYAEPPALFFRPEQVRKLCGFTYRHERVVRGRTRVRVLVVHRGYRSLGHLRHGCKCGIV